MVLLLVYACSDAALHLKQLNSVNIPVLSVGSCRKTSTALVAVDYVVHI